MRGHVRKRGNKWAAVVYIGLDEAGKKRYKWHGGFKTEGDAERALSKLVNDVHQGTYIEPTKETVEKYIRRWLSDKEMQIRFNTFKKYRWLTERHVIPNIGRIELSKLTPQHLQSLYSTLQRMDKPLSNRSILHLHNMVHEALDRAFKWGMVPRNVADVVDPPKPQPKEMMVWSADETQRFLEVTREYRYQIIFLLAVATGMRKAEIFGLRWRDVDLDNGHLYVRQTLVYKNGAPTFEDVKTEKSRRVVSIPRQIVDALRHHKAEQNEERLKMEKAYRNNDLVIARADGTPVHFGTVDKRWKRFIEDAGLPPIRFHDLRHTHATMLFEQGVPTKIVSERLGHARVNVTLDIYTHVSQEKQDDVAQQFGDRLFGVKKSAK